MAGLGWARPGVRTEDNIRDGGGSGALVTVTVCHLPSINKIIIYLPAAPTNTFYTPSGPRGMSPSQVLLYGRVRVRASRKPGICFYIADNPPHLLIILVISACFVGLFIAVRPVCGVKAPPGLTGLFCRRIKSRRNSSQNLQIRCFSLSEVRVASDWELKYNSDF